MTIYLCVIFLLLIFIYLYDYRKKNVGDSFSFTIIFLFFVLIPGLSTEMGSDTLRYEEWFRDLPVIFEIKTSDITWEPLFCLFMSFLKTISSNWVVAHVILISFINIAIFSYCKKYVNNKYTFLLLFFLLHYYEINFEPLRQSCAMAMIIWSLPYLQRKEYLKFYFLATLAVGFHYTAVICFVLPFLLNYKLCSIKVVAVCIAIFVASAVIRVYLGGLIDMLSYSLGYTKYDAHLESEGLNINGVIMTVVIKIMPVFAAMYVCQKKGIIKFDAMLNALAIMFVVFMVARTFVPIFERFTLMFSFAQIACYSDAIIGRMRAYRQPASKFYLFLINVYIVLAFAYNVNSYFKAENQWGEPNITRCVPYKSILD